MVNAIHVALVSAKMKEIQLTGGLHAFVDDEDYEELNKKSWYAHSDSREKTYAATKSEGKVTYMHRIIMGNPDDKVDHINGNGLDNRRENLRISTSQENARNIKKTKKPRSSKYKGVTKMLGKKRWKAHISISDKDVHLGYFDSEEEAARAYDDAAKKEFGDFKNLNFPNEDPGIL